MLGVLEEPTRLLVCEALHDSTDSRPGKEDEKLSRQVLASSKGADRVWDSNRRKRNLVTKQEQ